MRCPNKRPGFSLTELLVVVVVLSLLLAFGVPAMTGSGANSGRRSAAKSVEAFLTRGRAEAIATGEPVALIFVPAEPSRLPERERSRAGRAAALFRVIEDGQQRIVTEQVGRWLVLDKGLVFGKGEPNGLSRVNVFESSGNLTFAPALRTSLSTQSITQFSHLPYILFSPRGKVIYPKGSEENYETAVIGLLEGSYRNEGTRVGPSPPSGVPFLSEVEINRLSGRAKLTL